MTIHLCATCAVETDGAHSPDRICPICGDERQYLPKGTDLTRYSQAHLDRIARQLNTRPRKTLGFHTPAATLAASVASTA